jgi:cytochrome P450
VPLVRTMMHRISATVTGIDGVDTPERTERFRWFVERLQESVTLGWSTEDQYALMQRGLEVRKQFVVEFLAASVERRRALIADMHASRITRDDLPRDLLTMMLLHWNDEWDEDLHVREATLYLVASTGTTAQAAPHLLGHLFDWLDAHPEDRSRADDSDFLRRAAAESLRLHLPAPALLRQANTDVTLASGIEVKKGEKVGLIFRGANRDTTVFGADANEFNPWRTVPQSVRGWGLTFGGGEHMCIGRPLVTGLPSTSSESGTDGTLVQIIRSLLRAGARPDPASPAKYTEASHHDAYATFPLFLG